MKKRIRLQGILIFLAVITVILSFKVICPRWKSRAIDTLYDVLGLGLVLSGFYFRVAARGIKSEKSQEGRKLVIEGLYGLTRHPMYFGTFLIGSGIIAVLFQWWAFIIFIAVFLCIYIPQADKEAKYLSEHFGDEYRVYCQKVPRFFPDVFRRDIRSYLFFKWPWLKKEFSSLAWAISAIILIEIIEDMRLFGRAKLHQEFLILIATVAIFMVSLLGFKKK